MLVYTFSVVVYISVWVLENLEGILNFIFRSRREGKIFPHETINFLYVHRLFVKSIPSPSVLMGNLSTWFRAMR